MNYIRTLYFSAIIAGLGSMVSCGDAKYDALDTHAYIEEALSSTSQKVTVQASGESFTTLKAFKAIERASVAYCPAFTVIVSGSV